MIIVHFMSGTPLFQSVFESIPGLTAKHEEAYDTAEGLDILYCIGTEADWDEVDAAFREDPTVADAKSLTDGDEHRAYQIRLTDEGRTVIGYDLWCEYNLSLLEAIGSRDGWEIHAKFPSKREVSGFHEHLRDVGVQTEIQAVYDDTGLADGELGLNISSEQREALLAAYNGGYFDVPRSATQSEIADSFGISPPAFGERVRRGVRNIVEQTIVNRR